jgi:hypothetical protein
LATLVMICPAAASAKSTRRDDPGGLPWPAPSGTSEIPLSVRYLEGSSAGLAWEERGQWGDDYSFVVHYTSFGGGPSDVVAAPVMTSDGADVFAPDYSLVGSQLYLPESMGNYGLDVDTGADLPTLRESCWWRTGTACFTVERVSAVDSDLQLSLTPDATGNATIYSTPLIDGASTPQDDIYPIAVDDQGALIRAEGSRGSQPTSVGVLTYLDFVTGTYTTLDDSAYAESDQAAMDGEHIVWTHDRQAVYVDRSKVGAAPKRATPDTRVDDVLLSGDTFAYVRIHGGLYTGTLGGSDFTEVTVPGKLWNLTSLGGEGFAVAAGSSALDYGLYRVTPGAAKAGPLITRFGFAPPNETPPGADLNADGRSALATVSRAGTWSVRGNHSIHLGGHGAVPVVLDNHAWVARPAAFRPSTGRWSVHELDGEVRHVTFGRAGDVPVPAHYSGPDQATVLATYRPATAGWHIRGRPSFRYGHAGDIPVPGHYYGRTDHAAVFRPSNGTWCIRGHGCMQYGKKGDVPVPGDYDGDGRTDIAVYRPSDHTWHVRGQSAVPYGRKGDIPVLGDFDGDGRADIAIYRPSAHQWHIRGVGVYTFGRHDARPLEAAPE